MKSRIQWIPVVIGFIRKQQQVLVGQRPPEHSLAGLWEFPGGKIEGGESPEQALARELEEELGIQAEIGELKLAASHTFGETGLILLFYDIRFWTGEPKAVHHVELKWIEPEELKSLPIPDANINKLSQIISLLEQNP